MVSGPEAAAGRKDTINPAKKMLMVRADLAVSREASMVG